MGVALAAVKERLRGGCDAQRLVDICLHTVGHLSATQLAGWRNHCRRLVSEEHVRLDAKRRLVKLQHASGFSWQEVLLLARHCGLEPASPGVSGEGTDGAAILATTVELHAFRRVLCAMVPSWHNDCALIDRLFLLFSREPSPVDAPTTKKPPRATTTRAPPPPSTPPAEAPAAAPAAADGDAPAAAAPSEVVRQRTGSLGDGGEANGEAARRDSSPPNRQHEHRARTLSDGMVRTLGFEQLVGGVAWLLRGTSARRAELCFRCFDVDETGEVPRHHFLYLLRGMYLLYEPPLDENPDAEAATLARVSEEAEQFTRMMYELWDERGTGCLTAAQFDRAAHQHPLLVQAFALEAMETPAALATPPPSPARPPPPRRPRTEMGSELLCADEHYFAEEVVH